LPASAQTPLPTIIIMFDISVIERKWNGNPVTPPNTNSPAALFIADRVRDLKHRKSQKEIAREAGFVNANMLSLLKSGASKVPFDRIPALARALELGCPH
jgi:hypothetical protein